MGKKREKKTLFCYCHFGGELTVNGDKSVSYKGGCVDSVVIDEDTTYDLFVGMICDQLSLNPEGISLQYTVKFDRTCLMPLKDQNALNKLLQFSDDVGYVYAIKSKDDATPVVPSTRSSNMDSQLQLYNHTEVEDADMDLVGCSNTDNNSSTDQCEDGDHPSSEGDFSGGKSPVRLSVSQKDLTGKGQIFQSAVDFRIALYKYSLVNRFKYKYTKNSNPRIMARCSADNCPWKISAFRIAENGLVRVSKLVDKHEHEGLDGDCSKPCFNAKWLAELVTREQLNINADDSPKGVADVILESLSLRISYYQAIRVKEHMKVALHGKKEEAYRLVPWVCQHIMNEMPGTIASLLSSEDHRFKQLFVAYNSSIRGFQLGCRPLIFIDVLVQSRCTLLSATALDANDEVFPVAYGLMPSGSDIDWRWFLEKMKLVVGDREVVIISDGIQKVTDAANEVFGIGHHSFCFRRLKQNFGSYMNKLPLGLNGKRAALDLLEAVAFQRSNEGYNNALVTMLQLNEELYGWVLASRPENWANSLFKMKRWDKLSSEEFKDFNTWMSDECEKPILEFMKAHQCKLAEVFQDRRKDLLQWNGLVGEKIKSKIKENMSKADRLVVNRLTESVFQFELEGTKTVVDLSRMVCSCLEWQMTGIPCAHACSGLRWANLNVNEFIEKWYHREMQEIIYQEAMPEISINKIPASDDASSSRYDVPLDLLPPDSKKARRQPRDEPLLKRTMTCSACKQRGHNKKYCQNGF